VSFDGGSLARVELIRLEEEGDAIVFGWAIDMANDFSIHVLARDVAIMVVRLSPP
jgi:hypothetical protein